MEEFYSWFAYVADRKGFTVVERGVTQYLVERSLAIEGVELELSVDKLAKVLQCRKDTVTASLKKLEDNGVIVRKKRGIIRLARAPKSWVAKYTQTFPGTFRGTNLGTRKIASLNSCAQDEPSGSSNHHSIRVVTSSPNENQPQNPAASKNVKVVPIQNDVLAEVARLHELPKLDLSKYKQALLRYGIKID